MKYPIILLLALALFSCNNQENKEQNDNTLPIESIVKGEIEQLATGFKFTEGPAADAEGNVYFTDIPNQLILIWKTDNHLDTFRTESGGANGLFFDKDENLLACEGYYSQITSTSPAGDYKVIAKEYNGKKFNRPNDIWPDAKGGIYFTDPYYGGDETELPQDGMHVYYIKPNRNKVIRVCDDLVKPNGVIGTLDGKKLYVTDHKGKKTYSYDIQDDGTLSNKSVFANIGCDGMTIDKEGNLYLTPSGEKTVDIYSPAGEFLESIKVPERPSNVCFGGENKNHLFITARTSIYRVAVNR